MNLNLTFIGWIHGFLSLLALVALLAVLIRRKGSPYHRRWGRTFVLSYVLTCATSLAIYRNGAFGFAHWLAVIGLVVVAIGYLAARFKPPGWRYVHLIAMLLSGYNLIGGAVNEVFLRVDALRAMVGPNFFASPIVGLTQFANMAVFVLLIVIYLVATMAAQLRRRARLAT